jgi:cob(I)alamin adenosyltransferase
MSIATRTGDGGTTGLMYNRRVVKHHPRVEAYGCVDELNAALGLARASAPADGLGARLLDIQRDLVTVMGELATAVEDLPRYVADGFPLVTPGLTERLDRLVAELEAGGVAPRGWAMPGDTPLAAALDMARVVCRRAERRVCALHAQDGLRNDEIIVFLNRLADVLWLMARAASSTESGTKS